MNIIIYNLVLVKENNMKNEIQEVYERFAEDGFHYDITSYGENNYAIAVTDDWNKDLQKLVKNLRLGTGKSATWGEVQKLNKGIRDGSISNMAELLVKKDKKIFNIMLLSEKTENLNALFSQTMKSMSFNNVGEVSVVLTCSDGKIKYRAQRENNQDENA